MALTLWTTEGATMMPLPPSKKQTLLRYLERGITMVHLDARRPGVQVPAKHSGDPHLRLNLSYRYSIPDLEIDDERVQATLSFGGAPFQCILPWAAIFGITSHAGEGQVWPEDLPTEVMHTMSPHTMSPHTISPQPQKRPLRKLGVASPPEDEAPAQQRPRNGEDRAGAQAASAPKHPHLRLVR
jgi:stringent starvation protein B